MRNWAVTLTLALALAGQVRAESEVETLRTRVRELEARQQQTDAEIDELRALLVGEERAPRSAAPSGAAAGDDLDLDVLAGKSEAPLLDRVEFHGHLAFDYVGIANQGEEGVGADEAADTGLLPRSSFSASDLSFFVGIPLYENLYVATEVEYESGGDEIELDQAFAQWDLLPEERLSVRGGKFYFPFGIERYYQNAPTNPLVDRPASSLLVVPGTYSETGVELLGELALASSPEIVAEYELALVNGLGEYAFESTREARQNRDDNSGKSYGGRLGLVWDRWLRVGASGLSGSYDRANDDRLWAMGVDLRADWSAFTLRGEWVLSRVENPDAISADGTPCSDLPCPGLEPLTLLGGSVRRRGWYVEGTWKPQSVFARPLGPLEYVLRYDVIDDDQSLDASLDGQRIAAGIVLRPYEHFRLKAQYEIVDYESGDFDNNGFLLQGAVDW